MLDNDTKRRIDSARQILVGKVPDPKAQVEQITTAMIYKFMDDMDQESIELGGKSKFFANGYEQYAWSKLLSKSVSGFDRLNLYVEAITKMSQNPHLQPLFQKIFKDAVLPYRDPETLNLFLKEINGFVYDHSERLGDAFEYLLSVLGSQGDAGQFRTPRHIIKFIVEAIDPKKDETILDPACGTAGFLISAYKHIMNQNNTTALSPDEKARLMNNFIGYDISPDMVKLSLVNMYLHKFPNPNVYEYDTLTSEDKWDDTYDVILANPPFMSPKGGIRPHKRFSVQAKRSEVLFVDYIAEHLNINGRAGVIVPEGIIFQSQNAYKALRKMLVENYLYAVVSLPAGVFQPYSGVKTSILLMDKAIAKRTNNILFVKIENDGYDLGAQRRKIDKDDLPIAKDIIKKYMNVCIDKDAESQLKELVGESKLWSIVSKDKIADDGDYNLSMERYSVKKVSNTNWKLIKLGDIIETITPPQKIKKELYSAKGNYPIIDQSKNKIAGWTNKEDAVIKSDLPLVIFGDHTCVVKYITQPFVQGADGIKILKAKRTLLPKFLYYLLLKSPLESEGYKRHFSKLKRLKIPLPPLEVQKEIVAEIDSYQKIIDGARQVVENYKPHIKIDPDWPMVELGEICEFATGGTPKSTIKSYYGGEIKWLVSGDIHKGEIFDCSKRITEDGMNNSNAKYLPINSVLIALNGQGKTRGTVALLRTQATCNQSIVSINHKNKSELLPEYIYYNLKSRYKEIRNLTGDNQRSGLSISIIKRIKISLPSIEIQKSMISLIKKEEEIVKSNKQLIKIFEQKIQDRINEVWGE